MTNIENSLITDEKVISKIYLIRGHKIMLDSDLSNLYGVETKVLKQAVKRNIERFPEDFMFELTTEEHDALRSQIATSKEGRGGSRYMPMAFTEPGVAMLSSILNSETAIKVNIQIIRVFTKMREILMANKEILIHLEKSDQKLIKHDFQISILMEVLDKLVTPDPVPREKIGFRRPDETE